MLTVNNLTGFGGGGKSVQITNVQSATTTLTGASFGTAENGRILAVVFGCRENANPTTATIGGISATVAYKRNTAASPDTVVGVAYALVPTGTSGTVVINGLSNTKMISVFRVIGAKMNDAVEYSANGATVSGVDVTARGGLVAGSINISESTARTWSNATEADDTSFSSGGQASRFTTASRDLDDGPLSSAVVGVDGGSNPATIAVAF